MAILESFLIKPGEVYLAHTSAGAKLCWMDEDGIERDLFTHEDLDEKEPDEFDIEFEEFEGLRIENIKRDIPGGSLRVRILEKAGIRSILKLIGYIPNYRQVWVQFLRSTGGGMITHIWNFPNHHPKEKYAENYGYVKVRR